LSNNKSGITKQLNLTLLNARSIKSKRNLLIALNQDLNSDIIVIVEHWLKQSEVEMFNIQNFDTANAYCRQDKIGGGVMILVKTSLNLEYSKLEFLNSIAEESVLETTGIKLKIGNNFVSILGIYRAPNGKIETFLEKMHSLVLRTCKTPSIIAGDFNIDLLDSEGKTRNFTNLMKANKLKHIFNKSTRDGKRGDPALTMYTPT